MGDTCRNIAGQKETIKDTCQIIKGPNQCDALPRKQGDV